MPNQPAHRLRGHVNVLAEIIGERCTRRPTSLDATRAYLTDTVAKLGLLARREAFDTLDRAAVNLVVTLPGTQPQRPALVVGAHYDTVPGTPGADDNASAVALLLELLAALRDRPRRRTLRAVFFDCEEPPYFNVGGMGSQHDARQRRLAGEKLIGMICLESLGYYVASPPDATGLPAWARAVLRVAGGRSVIAVANPASALLLARLTRRMWRWRGGVPIRPAVAPRSLHVINLSDHRSYWDEGYAAVMLTDTAMLRNPHYHTASDRLATLDIDAMVRLSVQLARGVGGLVR